MKKLTHVDVKGRLAMVDVSGKDISHRYAMATGSIKLKGATIALIKRGRIAKGNVIAVAEVAGIQAAKRTAELIPLCHNIFLTNVLVRVELGQNIATAVAETKSTGETGVEMEALVAVSVALLTIYDMCKAVDKTMEIGEVRLVKKTKIKR
ncbi:MAG: cyclic pyranopterin monophosphate synthase MoaC [bacterium]